MLASNKPNCPGGVCKSLHLRQLGLIDAVNGCIDSIAQLEVYIVTAIDLQRLLHRPTVGESCIFGKDGNAISYVAWVVLVGFSEIESINNLDVATDSNVFI